MTTMFISPLASALVTFLEFKRKRGYRYLRAEFTLRSFARFLSGYVAQRHSWRLDAAILDWLSSRPERQAISTAQELSVIRQFWRYLQRRDSRSRAPEPAWPRLPVKSTFVPYVLSYEQLRTVLNLTASLDRPRYRRTLYRTLILVLYCTGLRFGEALRLRLKDVDLRARLLFVADSKRRSRWVPFHPSLAPHLARYLRVRPASAGVGPDDRFFVGAHGPTLPITTAHGTLCKIFRQTGMKPQRGRVGPRPYDLRHTFAVHRLTRWYRQGLDLQAHLPLLSVYMGHVDLIGTETYLTATPELLALAAARFQRRYAHGRRRDETKKKRRPIGPPAEFLPRLPRGSAWRQ